MARIRSIKVDLFMDDGLEAVSLEAHFLLAGLPVLADSAGRLEDRPKRIQAQIFPYRPTVDVDACLSELEKTGHVARYVVRGVRYLQVANWEKDQRPHVKEAASAIPPPADSTEPRQSGDLAGNSPGTRRGESAGIKGMGSGVLDSGSGGSASQGEASPSRPDGFKLEHTGKPVRQPRKQSAQEALYRNLECSRESRCVEVGEPFIPDRWSNARQNKDLGDLVKAPSEAQDLFVRAWSIYLADDGERARTPAWSLGWFMAGGVRAKYETMAAREEAA